MTGTMRLRIAATLAVLAALAGCPGERGTPEAQGPAPDVARERLAKLLVLPEERFGPTREEAVARLGAPEAERVEETPNPDDPEQLDRRHHLQWPGLELVFVESPGSERAWLDRVRVRAASQGYPPDDLLGRDRDAVQAWLGPPARMPSEDTWLYEDPMLAGAVHATLRFEQERLREVDWEAEAD